MLKRLEEWLNKIKWYLTFIITASMVVGIASVWAGTLTVHDIEANSTLHQTVRIPTFYRSDIQKQDWTIKDHVMYLLREEGDFTWDEVFTAYCIIEHESGWNPEEYQYLANDVGIDRGLWQLNSYWYPEVSNSCSYDVYCSTRAAIKIYRASGWDRWNTYKKYCL